MENEERIKFTVYSQTTVETPTGKTYEYKCDKEEPEESDEDEETDSPKSLILSKHDRIVQLMDVED